MCRAQLGKLPPRIGELTAEGAAVRVWRNARARAGPGFPPPELVVQIKAIACELPATLSLPLSRLSTADIVREAQHWQKAGTIELVHDVTKNDLGAAVPPCGRFGANAAWYQLSLLTYNVLSALKSLALPAHLSAARPKRLRFAVFTLAGRILTHAGRLVLRMSGA